MALTPNTNEAFLREVDEELRRDRVTQIGRRWGIWIAVGIVAALLALAAFLYWQHREREAAGREGEQLQIAYDSLGANKPVEAARPLAALATSDTAGYRVLAAFTQADIALAKDDLKTAASRFAAIAGDTGVAPPFRDLALVRQTSAEYDTLKPDVVIARLKAIAVTGNPWFGAAGEQVAAAYLAQGRRDLAGALFGRIARDEAVPDTLRQRAVQMAGVLGVDAVSGNEKLGSKQ